MSKYYKLDYAVLDAICRKYQIRKTGFIDTCRPCNFQALLERALKRNSLVRNRPTVELLLDDYLQAMEMLRDYITRDHPRCKRCQILVGVDHHEKTLVGGYCSRCDLAVGYTPLVYTGKLLES